VPRAAFWISAALLAWTQVGYAVFLGIVGRRRTAPPESAELPRVSLIIAAYNEAPVIAARVANALSAAYPRDRLEVIVSVDGATDATADRARAAGADLVLENPRGGKVRAQDAAVRRASGDIVAFSDANSQWEPDALRRLTAAFGDPEVGYACGQVRFLNDTGTNQEGLYWRYEMWLRRRESDLHSVTGGNGAIYAVRRDAYIEVDPVMGHDLSFPFNMVKRGLRAVYVPEAQATEKMVPTIEGEWRRKRRMMSHVWPIMLRGGLADLRGYPPLYAVMIVSHRLLRYSSPLLHVVALVASLLAPFRTAALAQAALLAAAAAGGRYPRRPLLVARYYVLTTASSAAGLYDWLRHGTEAGWDAAEGTR
jgi:cellulose synthase/poly-beta-1,6-N-acetylglucosamine synthase-like glycosyltransferase